MKEPLPGEKILKIDRGSLCVLTQSSSKFTANAIADSAEISYQKVVDYLGLVFPRKITILVKNDDPNMPARAFAAIGRIIVPQRFFKNGIPEGLLIHEITHTLIGLSGPFVGRVERVSTNYQPARFVRHLVSSGLLNEGLASFMDVALNDQRYNRYRLLNAHLITQKHFAGKITPGLLETLHKGKKLFLGHGKPNNKKKLGIRYIIATSFVRYLIETHGINDFLKIYQGMLFSEVYNKSLNALQDDWLNFLNNQYTVANDTVLRTNSKARKLKSFSKISDIFICRKMDIDEDFINEGKRRKMTKKKCAAILKSRSNP